jgi:hypothetical protein
MLLKWNTDLPIHYNEIDFQAIDNATIFVIIAINTKNPRKPSQYENQCPT